MKNWGDYQKGYEESAENADEVRKDLPLKNDDASPSRSLAVPDASSVLAVAASNNELVVHQQRQEIYALMPGITYSGAIEQIRKLLAEERPVENLETSAQSVALRQTAQALVKELVDDGLEEVRRKQGLDKMRAKILAFMRDKLSYEHGLQLLNVWTMQHLQKPCTTIQEANALFPHLTLTEISFFPLLKKLPVTFLAFGTTFDAQSHFQLYDDQPGADKLKAEAQQRIPQQYKGAVYGLSYVIDSFLFSGKSVIAIANAYEALGLTESDVEIEFVAFKPEIREKMEALIPLSITNARLFEKVWEESRTSLQVGLGRVIRAALIACELPISQESVALYLNLLSPQDRARVEERKKEMMSQLLATRIYNPVQDRVLEGEEIIKLIGILNRVPACLLQKEKFEGFMTFYNTTVRFHASTGEVVEECMLSEFHAREATLSIQDEIEDTRGENRTVSELMKRLTSEAQTKIWNNMNESADFTLSELEQLGFDAWLQRGVALRVLPEANIVEVTTLDFDTLHKESTAISTMKIGRDEARQYVRTLLQLPGEMLGEVKQVQKEQVKIRTYASYVDGTITAGTYDKKEKMIRILEPSGFEYPNVNPMIRAERSTTLLHECGEAIWTLLSPTEKLQWHNISWSKKDNWKKEKVAKTAKHFLSHYSQTDSKEDFCEHFAFFVAHGPEFLTRAFSSMRFPLGKKYRFIKDVFAKMTGAGIDFSTLQPWSIEELHGALKQEITKIEVTDANKLLEEEAEATTAFARSQKEYKKIRRSFHTLDEDADTSGRVNNKPIHDEENEPKEDEDDEVEDDNDDWDDGEPDTPEAHLSEEARSNGIREVRNILLDVLDEEMSDEDKSSLREAERSIFESILDGGNWEEETRTLLEESGLPLGDEEIDDIVGELNSSFETILDT